MIMWRSEEWKNPYQGLIAWTLELEAYEAGADAMYAAIDKAASEGRIFITRRDETWVLEIIPAEDQ